MFDSNIFKRETFGLSKNFYSWNPSNFGIIGRITILLAIPLVFTWTMFDPLATFDLKTNVDKPQKIQGSEINNNLAPFILAGFFQTTLDLGWYKICLKNYGALIVNKHVVINGKDDRGNVQMVVMPGVLADNVENYRLNSKPFGPPECLRFNGGNNGLSVGTSTVNMGMPMNDSQSDRIATPEGFITTMTLHLTKLHSYITQDWVAFWIKYTIILIAWSTLLLLLEGLWVWVGKRGL